MQTLNKNPGIAAGVCIRRVIDNRYERIGFAIARDDGAVRTGCNNRHKKQPNKKGAVCTAPLVA